MTVFGLLLGVAGSDVNTGAAIYVGITELATHRNRAALALGLFDRGA